MNRGRAAAILIWALAAPAAAGPPYVSDDPQTTDYRHFEIYLFNAGTVTRDGTAGAAGIDFNYGAAPNLQLTAVVPLEFDTASGDTAVGNIELAAKYKFLHREDTGLDVAAFPRVFLPSASHSIGDRHASLLLPVWVEKDWGAWSAFGGGGCAINRGGDSQDYCLFGWALTRAVRPDLHLGLELYHRTADTRGGRAATGLGGGAIYDLTDNYHLLAWFGPGLQNAAETNRCSWYTALLFTF